ncbi:hypothetical protein AKJ35_00600 [candidate division MSBL1 archaeon SCGC-AAA833F18]|uniref:Protease HtpX homolog n=2 Tax=candidate division MSBL1 TaxID=215777 RepID=A0A133VSW6_9EURY|nr:hypothetical protein AKJ48_01035 [candidate division MSBL1 archaeon SCGC-AAA261O19]KXB09517.1 hypothetical protein AKJ35_00600 [candidate division MSBL1 archaeon SCGC-AAA833F18]
MGAHIRTVCLLVLLTVLLVGIGYAVGFFLGIPVTYTLTIAFGFAILLNIVTYWYSHKWVLKMYKAKIVSEKEEPKLHQMIGRLATYADLPKPKVAITKSDTPNAFATGRNPSHAVIAVTKGAKNLLSEEELEGVLSHEMAHIKNRDMLVNTMAAMIAGAIAYIGFAGRFGLFFGGGRRGGGILALIAIILLPIAAILVRFSISRTREYGADREGANISGKPLALASGLKTIENSVKNKVKFGRRPEKGNPATSHLFIVNPFRGSSLTELFSTHPATEKRIERLEKIAADRDF